MAFEGVVDAPVYASTDRIGGEPYGDDDFVAVYGPRRIYAVRKAGPSELLNQCMTFTAFR